MAYFRDLRVWQKAHELTLAVYRASATFPANETYGLTNQLRRSGASIPANIAEGCGRGRDSELVQYLRIAQGSANELEYHLLLARDFNLLQSANHSKLEASCQEIQRMLASLIQTMLPADRRRSARGPAAS